MNSSRPPSSAFGLLPLGALAAGFGFFNEDVRAQSASAPQAAASAATDVPKSRGVVLPSVVITGKAETDQNSLRAVTSTVGKGEQALRDIPQSVTVVTEKLLEDRRVDTVKQALHQTAGITFQAAEGGEEDVRLRGFSLATTGDIFVDGVRDPAFYERDVFSFERVELLRGSASMLFGRGSTGGVVDQVNRKPVLANVSEVSATVGPGGYVRGTGDFNIKTGPTSAVRIAAMWTDATDSGNFINKQGIAPGYRHGRRGHAERYALKNRNGIQYELPWLRKNNGAAPSTQNPGVLIPVDPRNYYGAASDYNASSAQYATLDHVHRFGGEGGLLHTVLRNGYYDRDQRSGTNRFCVRSRKPAVRHGPPPDAAAEQRWRERCFHHRTDRHVPQPIASLGRHLRASRRHEVPAFSLTNQRRKSP